MVQETNEQKQARLAKQKAAQRKREAEINEALLIAYMAGNVGNGYAMYAAVGTTTNGGGFESFHHERYVEWLR